MVAESQDDYQLIFRNDGDSDVLDARWEWIMLEEGKEPPTTTENPFPIDVLPPGAQVRVRVFVAVNDPLNYKVRTYWQDTNGQHRDQVWPITW